jgi:pyruvate/2-oxoglutarate dehydrogenase complex dihydrolipoamide dehydrogenase (E3) component
MKFYPEMLLFYINIQFLRLFAHSLAITSFQKELCMPHFDYDLTIIGGGSGGLTAARVATALGARVLLIDKQQLGGDCLHYGCVPSKSLIHIARTLHHMQHATEIGLTCRDIHIDIPKISAYVQRVIQQVSAAEQVYTEGVTVKFGHIAFKSPTELQLNNERITTRNTLIATGSHPFVPPIEGLTATGYLTNEDVFDLQALPESLIIAGGGPIGVELAQALARLGTNVTIIQGPARILPKEEPEVSATISKVLRAEGITIIPNTRFIGAERRDKKKVIIARQNETTLTFEADELLLALGRQPNVATLNLDAAQVAYDSKGIKVNKYLQTSTPNILAIGDVIGGYLFTHVAAYQAGIAVQNALLPIYKKKVDYRVVPWCTFTDPEAARVGLTRAEAEQQYKEIREEYFPWSEIDRAQAEHETIGFIKLILTGRKDEIVGAHLVGAGAGELLGELSLAIQHHMTLNDIFHTIHPYPTITTGLQQAAFEAYLKGRQASSNRKIVETVLKLRNTRA